MEYNFIDGASKFDLDYVLDKPKSAKAYFTYLLARCLRMFEYKNLPDTIPADIFDRYVMMNGVACVGKDQNGDLRVFFGNWGGEYDVYWYQYNDEGIRVKKSINGYADITYILNGSQIVSERINSDILLIYVYDEAGTVIGLKYRTSSYAEGVYDCKFFSKK